MRFGGIAKTSTIDFPGVLACVLFTQGCNLDCFYCHNRPLIAVGDRPLHEAGGGFLSEEEIKAFLEKRRGLLDGVVVSGGEPTLQPDLASFLSYIKALGYRVKLDTNGLRPDVVEKLLTAGLCDYVAVDYKAPADAYGEVCRGKAEPVQQTIALLHEAGATYEVRTTVYPGLREADLRALLAEVPPAPVYRLNVYQPPTVLDARYAALYKRPVLGRAQLEELLPALRQIQPNLLDP